MVSFRKNTKLAIRLALMSIVFRANDIFFRDYNENIETSTRILDLTVGAMPGYAPGFNRILDDLARRQLILDFQFGSAGDYYEAVRSIGAGAFGIVCEASDSNSREKVR